MQMGRTCCEYIWWLFCNLFIRYGTLSTFMNWHESTSKHFDSVCHGLTCWSPNEQAQIAPRWLWSMPGPGTPKSFAFVNGGDPQLKWAERQERKQRIEGMYTNRAIRAGIWRSHFKRPCDCMIAVVVGWVLGFVGAWPVLFTALPLTPPHLQWRQPSFRLACATSSQIPGPKLELFHMNVTTGIAPSPLSLRHLLYWQHCAVQRPMVANYTKLPCNKCVLCLAHLGS